MLPATATQICAMPLPPANAFASMTACLSPHEMRLMENYRHPRRRQEFVTGRAALKRALFQAGSPSVRICPAHPMSATLSQAAREVEALPDDTGQPRLWVDRAMAETRLSIAHAGGWAAAACSDQPIGVDVVDIEAPAAISDDLAWLVGIDPAGQVRLRALLWGLRECLLKSGQVEAKTVWALDGIDAVPCRSAEEIVAHWPQQGQLVPIDVQVDDRIVDGAFMALSPQIILVMILMPTPHP